MSLEQLMVMLRDGRILIAFLRSLDQFGKCVNEMNEIEIGFDSLQEI